MRPLSTILFAAALCAAAGAQAAVSQVSVTLGPKLQAKAASLGQQDLNDLAETLRATVQNQLRHDHQLAAPGAAGDQVTLVIDDAKPNRPTNAQLGAQTTLSQHSLSLGGAEVSGTVTLASGQTVPIHERFFETEIQNDQHTSTWTDAELVFASVARDLAKQQLAER